MKSVNTVLLAFGSNDTGLWGPPKTTIERAFAELGAAGVRLTRVSSLARTKPLGPLGQPDYLNAAAAGETLLDAEALLTLAKHLEQSAGRRPGPRWGPRPLDIDILDFAGEVRGWDARHDPDHPAHLVLPHPELQRRKFVLEPLAEIAPEWRHPVLGKTACEMLSALVPSAT